MGRKFGISFSWKRASGISAARGRIARATGIPTTRGGRQRKFGASAGCAVMLSLGLAAAILLSVGARVALGDHVKLKNGSTIEGVVGAEDNEGVTVRLKAGTAHVPWSLISSIERGATTKPFASVLPEWQDVLGAALSTDWGKETHQIPATVVDVGNLRNVPYLSYRCGDYEMNIYGDPAMPVGVEIGVYHDLLKSDKAKQNCQDFMLAIIKNPAQRSAIKQLGFVEGSKEIDGYTIEITPETAPDAYEGWWISVYNIPQLDAQRATDAEMKAITVRREELAIANPPKPGVVPDQRAMPSHDTFVPTSDTDDTWTRAEIAQARPYTGTHSSGGGSVYVRGYTRRDGTYVHSYTRAAPGFGHSGGHGLGHGGGHR
jgi:hypothetical protein